MGLRNRSTPTPGSEAKADKLLRGASVATVATLAAMFIAGVAESAREYVPYNSQRDAAKAKVAGVMADSNVLRGLVRDSCDIMPSVFRYAPNNHQMAGLRSGRLRPNDPNVVWPVTQKSPSLSARWFSSPVSRGVVVRAVHNTVADTAGLPLTKRERPVINRIYHNYLDAQLYGAVASEEDRIVNGLAGMRTTVRDLENSNDSDRPLMTAFGYLIDEAKDLGITPGPVNSALPAIYGVNGEISIPPLTLRQAFDREPLVNPYCLVQPPSSAPLTPRRTAGEHI